ncbi:hypothetical protein N9X51_01070 [Alphaproteobacteria bacterium]|nr:hypothetical protein [Alphaproteobacteria bacterium]
MIDRVKRQSSSSLALVVSSLLLTALVLRQFQIRNQRLLAGNWDEGNLWFLLSKAANQLKPNVDFVSGYSGGFEAIASLLGRIIEFDFFFVQIAQGITLAFYFGAAYWTLSRFIPRDMALGGAVLVAYAGYGAWVTLSPGSLVQVLTVLLLGFVLPRYKHSRRSLLAIGGLAALCLLVKQSGIFVILFSGSLICLRFLRWASKLGISARFLTLLPYNLPLLGYLLLRYDFETTYVLNDIVLLPWVILVVFLNRQALALPVQNNVLSISFLIRAMWTYLLPFIVGVTLVLAFFPLYYGAELAGVLHETFIRMPALIDRHVEGLLRFNSSINFLFSVFAIGIFITVLEMALNLKSRTKLLIYFVFISLAIWLSILSGFWVRNATLIWVATLFAGFWAIKWFVMKLNDTPNLPIEQTLLFRLVLAISLLLATVWPYPTTEFLSGICVTAFFIAIRALPWDASSRDGTAIKKFAGILFILSSVGIERTTNALVNSFTEKEMVVRTGVFSSAIISHQREQRFMRLASHMRQTLPPDTRIAGYPNLAMPMIAAGFVPVTFQGNYFGDDGVDIAAFVDDVQEKQVDCVLVNESGWPYSSSFPYFPNSELIIAALGHNYQFKHRFDLIGYYCLAGIALSGSGVKQGENLR